MADGRMEMFRGLLLYGLDGWMDGWDGWTAGGLLLYRTKGGGNPFGSLPCVIKSE